MNPGTWSYYVAQAQRRQDQGRPVYVAYVPGCSPQHVSSMAEAEEMCRGVSGAFVEVEFGVGGAS